MRPGRNLPPPGVDPSIWALRPWYHDFSSLGLRTDFRGLEGPLRRRLRMLATALEERRTPDTLEKGARHPLLSAVFSRGDRHRVNQREKERVLLPLLEESLDGLPPHSRCLDLFCADGYYACHLARLRSDIAVVGVDLDPEEIARARAASRALGLTRNEFHRADAVDFVRSEESPFDLVLCAGGLYHLRDPLALLGALHESGTDRLVVQSVVTLETEDPGYFVSPAPGWRHGCRFTHGRLLSWLTDLGWGILRERRVRLPGNRRLRDRGSSFFLCSSAP